MGWLHAHQARSKCPFIPHSHGYARCQEKSMIHVDGVCTHGVRDIQVAAILQDKDYPMIHNKVSYSRGFAQRFPILATSYRSKSLRQFPSFPAWLGSSRTRMSRVGYTFIRNFLARTRSLAELIRVFFCVIFPGLSINVDASV
jgi:hypothetical protein